MSQKEITPEILAEFVYADNENNIIELLDQYPGLDEYVVPLIALMRVIDGLMIIDRIESQRPDGHVVDFVSTINGGIGIRNLDNLVRQPEDYIPHIVSLAREHITCLNEKGYQLLSVLVEGQNDAKLKEQARRYQYAFRRCLDQGIDDKYLFKLEQEDIRRQNDGLVDLSEIEDPFLELKAFFSVKNTSDLKQLVLRWPWMEIYAVQIPFDFNDDQLEIRHAFIQFYWPTSWHDMRRALKTHPVLLTSAGINYFGKMIGLAEMHTEEHPEHAMIAKCLHDAVRKFKRCAEEGVDHVLLEETDLWDVGLI